MTFGPGALGKILEEAKRYLLPNGSYRSLGRILHQVEVIVIVSDGIGKLPELHQRYRRLFRLVTEYDQHVVF